MDHLEEAEGAISGGCQTRRCNAAVETHGRDGLGEGEFVHGRCLQTRKLAKDLVIGFGIEIGPEVQLRARVVDARDAD